MWQIKKLPFYIDLIFCLVLLPAMMTLLPIERWLINNSLFVYLLVSWLYIVYILNRRFIMPFMFAGKKRFWIAVSLILLTAVGTYPSGTNSITSVISQFSVSQIRANVSMLMCFPSLLMLAIIFVVIPAASLKSSFLISRSNSVCQSGL